MAPIKDIVIPVRLERSHALADLTAPLTCDICGAAPSLKRVTHSSDQAVSNWKARGRFPTRQYIVMGRALLDKGVHASPSLWGMSDE